MAASMAVIASPPACLAGAYGTHGGDFVVVVPSTNRALPGQRYLFRDGRRGSTADADAPVRCVGGAVAIRERDGRQSRWSRLAMNLTDVRFDSVGTPLAGQLVEPRDPTDVRRPLVVMVHGSERTPAIGNVYAYALAAQGLAVFVYDKRGTGASQGDYTQNFELLADDAGAALVKARQVAAGRVGRAGYFGGSQGGWVAPLAATRSPADFVVVGFGLVASPIEEDREQMVEEARAAGLDSTAMIDIARLSQATARLVSSHFVEGYDKLAEVRRRLANVPWAASIRGEYSGDMLRMSDADLRRIGRARFDNLELIWNYDAVAALRKLDVPLLWVLAEKDREAPIEGTRQALAALMAEGRKIDLYMFPDTDHGMVEFLTKSDGSRAPTRITNGYLRLVADWIKGDARGEYGRAQRIR
jgi:uncharacterized protein